MAMLVDRARGEPQVIRSHSRPKTSNDNPYSEVWFKTLKYAPAFLPYYAIFAWPPSSTFRSLGLSF
ncbi:hypothetical protein [Actinoplanes siamensis]|uniref:hypothetical protein n=1 Tax=Actinoplanes siamensis TaxID=1223317 RepID=UPI001940CF67|nr:hypothetical protein [Actinoplanes siamensis]